MRAVLSSATPSPTCWPRPGMRRSEEHTSELQSLQHLVCRLLLEKKRAEPFAERAEGPDECIRKRPISEAQHNAVKDKLRWSPPLCLFFLKDTQTTEISLFPFTVLLPS